MAAIYGPPTSPQPVQPAPGAASGLPSGNAPAQNNHSFGGYSIGQPTNQPGVPLFGQSPMDINSRMQTQAQPAGPLSGPGFGESYIQQNIGQYGQPSALETFANQQLQGNNPYYDQMRTQADAGLNSQLAARGHYNSQGAGSAIGNLNASMYADQFANMGNLLGQSGNMQLNRENSGVAAAGQAQGLQQGRLDNQFSQLGQIAGLGAGTVGGFYGQGGNQSGDAAMAGINAGANAAGLQGQGQAATSNLLWSGIRGAMGMPGGGGSAPGGGQTFAPNGLMNPTQF